MTTPAPTSVPSAARAGAYRPRLEEIFDASQIITDASSIQARAVDGLRPDVIVQPVEATQVAELVRVAAAEQLAIIPCAGATKLAIGAVPERYNIALDLSRMNRILACDPDDLTLGVEPGVRLTDLLRTLREHRQFLPLAVPFAERATIGGIAAANPNSPLRHSYGGLRDFCLGMEFVTGSGERCKSGGRVVKNVTGYDLHKLLIGSLGTLAVITRVNFRMFPIPPAQRTFLASYSNAAAALTFCRAIAESPLSPQIVELASPSTAAILSSNAARLNAATWWVIVSAAGLDAIVERHARDLARLAQDSGAAEFSAMEEPAEGALLARLCEFPRLLLDSAPGAIIFRINAPPSAMPALLSRLDELASRAQFTCATLTRASGFLYAALFPQPPKPAAEQPKVAAQVFDICASSDVGARAMIEWCSSAVKREVSVWGPARPDFEIMHRLKRVFDPQRVLSPGRFAGGI